MKTTLTLWGFRPDAFTGCGWLFARLVCWWTRSEWAHVGVSFDGLYIEADPFRGVVEGPVPENAWCIRSWIVHDTLATEKWINRQLNKPYDWPGILGFVIERSEIGRRHGGRWFCSELAAMILRRFGIDICAKQSFAGSKGRSQVKLGNEESDPPAWEITPAWLIESVQTAAPRPSGDTPANSNNRMKEKYDKQNQLSLPGRADLPGPQPVRLRDDRSGRFLHDGDGD